ncbi:Clp protease N-terminal domain-containing protein [Catellatospora sp. NPDC049133]|uniref:Clp protease N-terminal domain-containing protein n=1 Tax=Catellatospora sp. NPDC049133 TaxID=3155499 RepID=UPI0033E8B7EA
MFEWLTAQSRRAIVTAQSVALSLGHDTIDSGHLLFGLLDVEGSVAASVLTEQLDTEVLREAYLALRPAVPGDHPIRHLPFTGEVKRLLELALREALSRQDSALTTVHLLLAVAGLPDGVGGRTLTAAGATPAALRAALLAKSGDDDAEEPLPSAPLPFDTSMSIPRRLGLRLVATLTWYAVLALVTTAVAWPDAGWAAAGSLLLLAVFAVCLGTLLSGPSPRRLVRTSVPAPTPAHLPAPLAAMLAAHGMRDVQVRMRASADWHGFSLRTDLRTWLGVTTSTAAQPYLPFMVAHEAAHLVRNDRMIRIVGTSLWLLLCACGLVARNAPALAIALIGGLAQHVVSRWCAEFACDAAAARWAGADAAQAWLDESRQRADVPSGLFSRLRLWCARLYRPPLRLAAARLARAAAVTPTTEAATPG